MPCGGNQTLREKLVQILRTAPFGGKVLDYWWFENMIRDFADYLIENGITILEDREIDFDYNAEDV